MDGNAASDAQVRRVVTILVNLQKRYCVEEDVNVGRMAEESKD